LIVKLSCEPAAAVSSLDRKALDSAAPWYRLRRPKTPLNSLKQLRFTIDTTVLRLYDNGWGVFRDTSTDKHEWLLLIHQIPPQPSYFRVKIWRRLQQIGAVAVKQSVYVMPKRGRDVR
jgi:hypothetical protein